jgi:hypothetical protein
MQLLEAWTRCTTAAEALVVMDGRAQSSQAMGDDAMLCTAVQQLGCRALAPG